MPISVRTNIRQTKKTLKRWQRKQIPFAAANALNDLAFQTKDHIVRRIWPNAFPNMRNQRFPRVMFRVAKAKKNRLISQVYDGLNIDWIDKHIEGGSLFNRTIPTDKIKRTARGRIPKGKLPRALPRAFKADINGRGEAVWQEQRDGSLKMMYHDKDSVNIPRVFPFYIAGRTFAATRWARLFEKRIEQALRTARR